MSSKEKLYPVAHSIHIETAKRGSNRSREDKRDILFAVSGFFMLHIKKYIARPPSRGYIGNRFMRASAVLHTIKN